MSAMNVTLCPTVDGLTLEEMFVCDTTRPPVAGSATASIHARSAQLGNVPALPLALLHG
jgi:hypothetical protein